MVLKYEDLTYEEISELDREKTVFLVSIAPLEEHSYYLPVGVDHFNSEFFATDAAQKFEQQNPEYTVVLHPALAIGSDCFRFPGTIDIPQKGIYLVAKGIGASLAARGFKNVMFIGLHGGPRHIVALEQACRAVNRKYKANLVAPFGGVLIKMFMDRSFMEEVLEREIDDDEWFKIERDLHAGFIETSLMLHHHPDLVKPSYKAANEFPKRLWDIWKRPSEKNGWEGMIGYPALASKEKGDELAEKMSAYFQTVLNDWIFKNNIEEYKSSVVSKAPFFNVYFSDIIKLVVVTVLFLIVIILL